MSHSVRALGLCGLVLIAAAAPAAATSFVMVSDQALADQASAIVEGSVVSVEPSPAGTAPSTDYLFEIDHLIKGYTAGSTVVVRVLGGVRAEGMSLKIWGAPTFREGDRALLFLNDRADGAYGIVHFMLGAFHEVQASGLSVAIRNLADAEEVQIAPDGSLKAGPGVDQPRDLGRFTRWLGDRANGLARTPDYHASLSPDALKNITGQFTLFEDSGLNLRWFDFDRGGSVTFRASSTPQEGLADGGYSEYQNALMAWNGAGGTKINYVYGGTTTATGGLKTFDNVNTILFNDPNNEVGSAYSCSRGGTLAVSGPWFDSGTTGKFNGRTFIQIQGADTITNSGIACFFQFSGTPMKAAEELFGHELGHTLGLSHSCGDAASGNCNDPVKNDALMRAFIHDDGRGARLGSDDLAAVRFLYLPGTIKKGVCKNSTTSLCLDKRFQVSVNWNNQFNGSSGVGRAIPKTAFTGFFSFGDPSNIELLVKILTFPDAVKVFYGELTNLQFTITVTDTGTGDVKTYSNTPGDCGAIDQAAFAPSTSAGDVSLPAARQVHVDPTAFAADTAQPLVSRAGHAASGACQAGRNTLCLLNGRFTVTVDWSNPGNGTSGQAVAGTLSKLVGTFYFTDPSNVELMTKVVQFPDRIAFFYGALSDLPYTIHVTDNASGTTKTYNSTAGTLCGGLDNSAFLP
ncbi:MAG TPA: hypothetical protein VIH93_00010 [Thermoanaerobaculia bacterium]